jgi:hypothetical protein
MRIAMLGCTLLLLVGSAASAETPAATEEAAPERAPVAASGAGWDDSHMASRYQETPRSSRPRVMGESGYGALASGSAATQEQVPDGIEFTTQRQWVQGAFSSSKSKADEPRGPQRSGSGIVRGSTLRANSVSSRR